MKRPSKIALLSLAGIAAVGAFLWMRSLASWRPAKIGQIPPGTSVNFLSSDAKTAFLWRVSRSPVILDVESGREMEWPVSNSSAYPEFSPSAPNWVFTLKVARQKSMEVRDFATGRLKRTFRWPKTQFNSRFVSDSNSNHMGIVEGDVFRQWNIATGQQLQQVQLDIDTLPGDSASYAISPDGKRLVGYSDNRGVICDTSSGKTLRSWKINSFGGPQFFSDDARVVVVYTYDNFPSSTVFVDTATGKVKWKVDDASSLYHRTGQELLLLSKRGCDILDVNTGRPTRHLPGPTGEDEDNVLRATPDYIYTLNDKKEILRWRAR